MANPKRQQKISKAVQTLADQIWDSLAAYASTLKWVPNPRQEDEDGDC